MKEARKKCQYNYNHYVKRIKEFVENHAPVADLQRLAMFWSIASHILEVVGKGPFYWCARCRIAIRRRQHLGTGLCHKCRRAKNTKTYRQRKDEEDSSKKGVKKKST